MHRSSKIIWLFLLSVVLSGYSVAGDSLSIKNEVWSPSPSGAALRSFLLPGWGQAYVGSPLKAVIYGGIEQTLIFGIYKQDHLYRKYKGREDFRRADSFRNYRNRMGWYLAGALIVSMLDAYVDAHLYDFDVSDDFSDDKDNSGRLEGLSIYSVRINFSWRFE